ncbi:MAG: hypothetical protein H7177_11800 [Rhizobacter sp.]|nr:hypothetical protein [Bacteriovorax sp.]
MESSNYPVIIIIGTIVVFFICRELLCWYWKINKIVSLLEEIAMITKKDSTTMNIEHNKRIID